MRHASPVTGKSVSFDFLIFMRGQHVQRITPKRRHPAEVSLFYFATLLYHVALVLCYFALLGNTMRRCMTTVGSPQKTPNPRISFSQFPEWMEMLSGLLIYWLAYGEFNSPLGEGKARMQGSSLSGHRCQFLRGDTLIGGNGAQLWGSVWRLPLLKLLLLGLA